MKIKFSYITLLVALATASISGYFSVWGLSQLFAGASTAVIIMASILEIGKVVTTTALHRYWKKLAIPLRAYLSISVIVLMVITSAGIYGFLSNAYQKTANKLEIHEGELSVLDNKKQYFEKGITDNEKIIATKNKRIDQLTNLRSNQETRLDSAKYTKAKDKARADIQIATDEIQKLSNDIDGLNVKNNVLSDSVGKYNTKMLGLKSTSEVAGEVGPLKFIAKLTNQPMDKVVNFLIILLICVFDPLAIALILLANRALMIESDDNGILEPKASVEPIEPTSQPKIEPEIEEQEVEDVEPEIEETPEIDDMDMSDIISPPSVPIAYQEPTIEKLPESEPTPAVKKEPVVPTGKIELENIKEIKENTNRGYSVNVPHPKANNTIQRIGSNKIVKNGDNDKLFFKRKQ